MPRVWNIGNTTVRNPKRIESALKVFQKEGFSGNAKGTDQESNLHQALKDHGVLDFEGNSSNWTGRKWRSAFYQLGFISYEKYQFNGYNLPVDQLFNSIDSPQIKLPYQITDAGIKLVNALSVPEIEEIYTRQLMCHELPNCLEEKFPAGKMKPFVLFLQVLTILQDRGIPGLSKFETGIFLQKFQNHTNSTASEIAEKITEFRQRCDENGGKNFNEVKKRYIEQLSYDIEYKISPDTVISDYSDTTSRYFSLSGLFTRTADRINIRENKRDYVKKLLENEPRFVFQDNPFDYFKFLYHNSYPLPTDDLNFSLNEIRTLSSEIKDRKNYLSIKANGLTLNSDPDEIQQVRYELIEYHSWEREEDFANLQGDPASVNDIINYLKALNKDKSSISPEIDDRPAYLEWAIWRSFLAINDIKCPIHETRRFPVDHDYFPRNTAPGGGPDLQFEFEDFALAVEVTLTVSNRQMAVESEPVRRHAVQFKAKHPNKEVYCLFVAPTLDNNVVETFRIGIWYNGDDEEFVNIIPMTLTDFISMIEILKKKKFTNLNFRNLLDRTLVFRNVRAPQWKASITNEVIKFRNTLLK